MTYQALLSRVHEAGGHPDAPRPSADRRRRLHCIPKTVVKTEKIQFEALCDASLMNVNSFLVPHLIRMAEKEAAPQIPPGGGPSNQTSGHSKSGIPNFTPGFLLFGHGRARSFGWRESSDLFFRA
jgi:hypothetical protein